MSKSTAQKTRVTTTVTGVRRTRNENTGASDVERAVTRQRSNITTMKSGDTQESSFIEESSFVRNPLNSRLGPRPSVDQSREKTRTHSLKGISPHIQEALILEDLLSVLMGIPGQYIGVRDDPSGNDSILQGTVFTIAPHLDASLGDMLQRILPLATYYTGIAAFVESRSHTDYGLVNHALCAAIRDMLKDYLTLVSQLEHAFVSSSTFSLQKLWFYVHPTLHTLSILYSLTTELVNIESPDRDSSDSSDDDDPDEQERRKALGLADMKSVINDLLTPSAGLVKGGEVVSIIWERMRGNSGDPSAFEVYRNLLHRASLPYSSILKQWTTTGNLRDPYEEVMVKEMRSINRGMLEMDFIDEYWEKRYTLRDGSSVASSGPRPQAGVPGTRKLTQKLPGGACVPALLDAWKHKILLAGKYVNVIRECGIDLELQTGESDDNNWQIDDERFYRGVEDAYAFANRTLLKLLVDDQQLLPRLRAMKNYFFLSQSAFLTHFMELASAELRKPPKNASLVKLQSLLDLALNMNFSGDEVAYKYKEDVKISLSPTPLYEWLLKIVSMGGTNGFVEDGGELDPIGIATGVGDNADSKRDKEKERKMAIIDVLTLDFEVPFPLSLVLSRKAVLRYQLLFRFLTHLKHIEQCLSQMWIDQKSPTWKSPVSWHPDFEAWRRRVLVLRARMVAVIQQIIGYVTMEVLEPNWRILETNLSKVTTVDQLLRDHVDFLDTCLKECMLTNARILKTHSKLFQTCLTFSQYSNQFNKSAAQVIDMYEQTGEIDESMEKRWIFLGKFEQNFDHYLKIHHDVVQYLASSETAALLALVVRLSSLNPKR